MMRVKASGIHFLEQPVRTSEKLISASFSRITDVIRLDSTSRTPKH